MRVVNPVSAFGSYFVGSIGIVDRTDGDGAYVKWVSHEKEGRFGVESYLYWREFELIDN